MDERFGLWDGISIVALPLAIIFFLIVLITVPATVPGPLQ
jgi:hypothetical protein